MAIFNGTSGNDSLFGTTGSDLIIGGRGDDKLYGNTGNDTFQFSRGDGSDTIIYYDPIAGNASAVLFTDVRSTELASITQSGYDLIIKYGVSDQLKIGSYFNPVGSFIKQFKFSDGVVWSDADIKSRTIQNGTDGSDTLFGYKDGPNTINGLGGDDTIFGGDGNDVLNGGDGNDKIYSQSSGNKILRGGAGNDYLSTYNGTGNNVLDGGSGDDTIYGGNGKDTLIGGEGNDKIYGGNGSSTLDGGSGINELRGGTGNDTYIVSNTTTRIIDRGGIDAAIVNANFVKIPASIETVIYGKGVQALPYWIDALTFSEGGGEYYKTLLGAGKTFTYSFPTTIPSYNTSPRDAFGFQPFNEAQKTFARQTLAYIATIIDVKFVEIATSDVLNNIAFADNDQQKISAGYAGPPGDYLSGSDIFLSNNADSASNLNPSDGNYSAFALIHELGHALGLKHPFSTIGDEGPYLPKSEDNSVWTVMTYTSNPAQYQAVYRPFDIATLQYLYGVNPSYKPGNDVYTISATATNLIYDGGGNDTLDASQQTLNTTIFLEPGYWGFVGAKASTISAPGQISINFGTSIENLKAGSGNDFLSGNSADNQIDGGAGDDIITGGAGDDTLEGGAGNDTIDGGDGNDIAVFANTFSNYTFNYSSLAKIFTVSSVLTGTDSCINIEYFKFSDVLKAASQLMISPSVPTVFLSLSTASILEGNSGSQPLSFTVNLSAAASSPVTVNYATANGTATAGSDYTAISGVLTFAAGEISKTVTVAVLGDTLVEADETFTLTLSNPSGASLGSISTTTATIVNDDIGTTPPPAQSKLDDFVVLQFASPNIVGADAGNDTYLISGSMVSAGQTFTISDSIGNNSIQLASGLSIASSQVASNALKLTLSNGGTVTVLNANVFTYDVGGNTSAGIDNVDVSYASFVQNTLGVALPAGGISTGGAKVIGSAPAQTAIAVSSRLDDFVVLQFASPNIVGADTGNDTYLISGSMVAAGQNLTISDSSGNNSIQLANGLSIASSQVASNALKLTLSNGGTVTVLNANVFTYDVGGNTSAGIDNVDVSYASFVQNTLGVALPASGIATGGAKVIGSGDATPLVAGSSAPVTATSGADTFSFAPTAARALVANTQITINQFDITKDKFQFDLITALGGTTLAALNRVEGISVQTDPFAGSTLINFGLDANGDAVVLTLAGVTAPASVVVEVV